MFVGNAIKGTVLLSVLCVSDDLRLPTQVFITISVANLFGFQGFALASFIRDRICCVRDSLSYKEQCLPEIFPDMSPRLRQT